MIRECAKTRCHQPATHAFRLLGPAGYTRILCAAHATADERKLTAGGHRVWVREVNPQPRVERVRPAP